ncbi:MAG: biotin/lipoyl-binding protein [Actinomycetota bacterium]|nr:biotin/lipoyl-binding protein [Actinomycetota bacterium]
MTPRSIGTWHEPDDRQTNKLDLPLLPPISGRALASDELSPGLQSHGHSANAALGGWWERIADAVGARWQALSASTGARGQALSASAGARWQALGASVGPGVRGAVGPGSPPWRRWTVGVSLLAPIAMLFVACGAPTSAPTTARVARSSVSTKVTGTGSLRSISAQNLGFDKGGKLTELDVNVGQQVKAGQIVARIDDFPAQSDLRKKNAALRREQAALDRIRDAEKVDAKADDASGASDVLDATKNQADDIDKANSKAEGSAQDQQAAARQNLRAAQVANDADNYRCSRAIGGDSRRQPGQVHQPGGLKGELFVPAPVESAACDRARKSAAAVADARGRVEEARAETDKAQQKRSVDKAQQQVAIENARRESRTAEHEAKDAEKSRPHDIDEQQAIIEEAQADVTVASRDVENTVLRAPVDGRVAAINGTLGEYLSSGSPNTPLSPGSRVSLPNVTSGVGPGLDTSKGDRPGGNGFMLLDDVNSFQVVVPFEESDAAKLQPNQRVDVTFDSVPDLTRQGTVVAVSPAATNIQDVQNFYATIVLNEVDSRLKDGMTAQANVIIDQIANALVVPTPAVQQGGKTGVVTMLDQNGQQRQVQVQLGRTGEGVTEVLSGLHEGDLVVVPEK